MLQYASLQTVLKHLDPNIRIVLARRSPKIRKIQKNFPIKVRTLEFLPCGVTINETYYRVFRAAEVVTDKVGAYEWGDFIKLTISNKNKKRVERLVPKNNNFPEAKKYLIEKLLKNQNLSVTTLKLDLYNLRWFPVGMKLRAKNLKLQNCDEQSLNYLKWYLQQDSFPLESIEMDRPSLSTHSLVSASKLQIVPWSLIRRDGLEPLVPKHPNLEFTHPWNLQRYSPKICDILWNFVNFEKNAGRRCCFVAKDGLQIVENIFDRIKMMQGVKTSYYVKNGRRHEFPLQLFIPCKQNVDLVVKVYCKADKTTGKLATLHFVVQPVDTVEDSQPSKWNFWISYILKPVVYVYSLCKG